jgi:hypothetical protein
MDYNETYGPNCNFSVIFDILLDAHAVQYGINFDNSVEIYLTYKKIVNQFQNFTNFYSTTYQ